MIVAPCGVELSWSCSRWRAAVGFGFDPVTDGVVAATCPGVPADAGAAPGTLRFVVTADNGYTLVTRAGSGPLVAETSAWNPTSAAQIYFECEQYDLPATTSEVYVVAGNINSFKALYLHAELDDAPRLASSVAWEVCDTGAPRAGTQPGADVAAFVTMALSTCTWSAATAINYPIDARCACDGADGVAWIRVRTTATGCCFERPRSDRFDQPNPGGHANSGRSAAGSFVMTPSAPRSSSRCASAGSSTTQ